MKKGGFTLVELLVVVVLVAGASVALLPRLGNARALSPAEQLGSCLEQLDRLARLEARQNGSAQLSFGTGAVSVDAPKETGGRSRIAERSVQLPQGLLLEAWSTDQLRWVSKSGVLEVRFDAHGNCPDYRVTGLDDPALRGFSINGTTGWMKRVEK